MNTQTPAVSASGSGAAGRPKYKRSVKNILIHKPMQREFSLMLIALLMVSTFAVGWVIHHTIHEAAFGSGGYRFGKVSPYEVLSDVSYQLLIRVSSILFLTLIVIAVFGIFFLHRVAGPVYRFRLTFLKINDGHVPHLIKLREGDFFAETADEINRFIKRLQFESDKKKRLKEKVDSAAASGDARGKEIKAILDEEWVEKE